MLPVSPDIPCSARHIDAQKSWTSSIYVYPCTTSSLPSSRTLPRNYSFALADHVPHVLQLGIPTANIPPSGLSAYPDLPTGVYYGLVGLRHSTNTKNNNNTDGNDISATTATKQSIL